MPSDSTGTAEGGGTIQSGTIKASRRGKRVLSPLSRDKNEGAHSTVRSEKGEQRVCFVLTLGLSYVYMGGEGEMNEREGDT